MDFLLYDVNNLLNEEGISKFFSKNTVFGDILSTEFNDVINGYLQDEKFRYDHNIDKSFLTKEESDNLYDSLLEISKFDYADIEYRTIDSQKIPIKMLKDFDSAIGSATYPDNSPEEGYLSIQKSEMTIGAFRGDEIIGFISGGMSRDNMYVLSIYVSKYHRRKRIGIQLCDEFIKKGKEAGKDYVEFCSLMDDFYKIIPELRKKYPVYISEPFQGLSNAILSLNKR